MIEDEVGSAVRRPTEKPVELHSEHEAWLHRLELSILENEHFMQTLVDAIPDPVFHKDTSGKLTFSTFRSRDSGFFRLFGEDKRTWRGRKTCRFREADPYEA